MKKNRKVPILLAAMIIALMWCPPTPFSAVMGVDHASAATVKKPPAFFVSAGSCYKLLNSYRKSAKTGGLRRDANLEKIAKIRAKEMATTGKFSHTRPNGKSSLSMIKGNVYKGENIAKGQRTCQQVSAAWYRSPGHRKNMLKKQYRKVGIAGYKYKGIVYWVQVFSS